MSRIAIASRSFSRHPTLRAEVEARFPDVRFNETGRTLVGGELIGFLAGCERAVVSLEPMTDAVLAARPELRVISKYGVGLDGLDLEAMRRRGIRLGWQGGVNRRAVAELVIAFAISLLRAIPSSGAELRAGHWRPHTGRELTGRTVGIIGCGHVGKDLARLVEAFGCTVLAHDLLDFPQFYREFGIERVSLDALLERAEVVTVHVPLDPATRGMIDARRLSQMRKDAILINAARGGIVDETALVAALVQGRIAGAALDVFTREPPLPDDPLLHAPNLMLTPHIGGSSEEAILAMGRAAIAGLDANKVPEPGDPCWPLAVAD
jgi:phosphoglycerate dehydrogenase-like enzyme